MARVGRLAGGIFVESRGEYFLVGNLKEPCNWSAHGFEPPGEINPMARPFVKLVPRGEVSFRGPYLELDLEGEALAQTLSQRFVIRRNGSVSERLWRLVTGDEDETSVPEDAVIPARWLGELPEAVWNAVRDTVLKCT